MKIPMGSIHWNREQDDFFVNAAPKVAILTIIFRGCLWWQIRQRVSVSRRRNPQAITYVFSQGVASFETAWLGVWCDCGVSSWCGQDYHDSTARHWCTQSLVQIWNSQSIFHISRARYGVYIESLWLKLAVLWRDRTVFTSPWNFTGKYISPQILNGSRINHIRHVLFCFVL